MKRFGVFCFLLCLAFPCFSQEQAFSFQSDAQIPSVNWESVEQNLNELELNSQTLLINNSSLKKDLMNALESVKIQINYSTSLSLRLADCESRYEQSEQVMKRWRLACGITVAVTVPTIITLVIIIANK